MKGDSYEMKRMLSAVLLTGAGGAVLSAALFAQPPVTPLPRSAKAAAASAAATAPLVASAAKGKRLLQYGSKYSESRITPQGEIITMSDTVWFRSEDANLTTEKALYNRNTKIASSPGKVNIKTQDADITANTGTAFFNTRDAQMRGQIIMLIRPRAQDKNAPQGSARRQFDAPANITCDKGDYNWRSGKGVLTGNLVIKQKNRTVTAEKALIDTKNQKVTLDTNVRYETTDGDKGKADKAILDYRDGATTPFQATNVSGISNMDELDDNAPAPTSDIGPPPASETAPKPAPQTP